MFNLLSSLDAIARHPRTGQAAKLSEDLDRYDRIIRDTRPELIIETGTYEGYSAAWFADRGLDVVTIDIDSDRSESFRDSRNDWDLIMFVEGSSTDPRIVERAAELAEGRRTMVSLDSDHSRDHVRAEIQAYGPLVTPGCYLVVEDGLAVYMPSEVGLDPLGAIVQELVDNPDWVRDEEIENLHPVSTSPMGWWRRA
jgi:cephalosporin hydroxylase